MTGESLESRLEFMQIDAGTRKVLRGAQPLVSEKLPAALDHFYAQVRRTPETRGQFRDDTHITKAQNAQLRHWQGIAQAEFTEDYAKSVQAIGAVHARIGLESRWYIGGYALVLEQLVRSVIAEKAPRGFGSKAKTADMADTVSALIKGALLDMSLVLDVYFTAAEADRAKAEAARAAAAAEQAQVVQTLAGGLARLAEGDLTSRIDRQLPGDYAKLAHDFDGAVGELHGAIAAVADAVGSVSGTVGQLQASGDDLARRTENQAASLEETAAAVEQITVTVQRSAETARQTSGAVAGARQAAEQSAPVVEAAIAAMGQIEQSSAKISQIIGVIDEIAFQTNLLALNAGVEAARAGEAGKGFAVVASEVRALAQRAADAAKEIKGLIADSSQQVAQGVALVGQTGQALSAIVGQVTDVHGLVADISRSTQEQATGLGQVNSAVNEMDRVTQQNAGMAHETATAAADLARQAQILSELIGRFRLAEEGVARARRAA
jgi:methyl-accepting chemotaxis protein